MFSFLAKYRRFPKIFYLFIFPFFLFSVSNDADLIKSLVLSNTTPRQARSLSRGRLSHSSRPASAVLLQEEDSETNSSDRGRCRGRIQYRQPRSQSVAVSSNQVLPWSLSKVKISETENPRKQVTFLPTWQILQPTSPKVQLVSYEDLRSTKELKKQPR